MAKVRSVMSTSNLFIQILVSVASVILLWKGADFFVDAAVRIARRLKVSDLVIGLTLVGLGTSAPEFAVSIGAALSGKSNISVANVVGSNIFNLGFILGGAAAFHPILTSKALVYRDGIFLIFVTSLITFFLWDFELSRYEGIILMALLVAYLFMLFVKKEPLDDPEEDEEPATWRDPFIALFGLFLILGGAHLLVDSASDIARHFGLSEWTIGVTIVAAGTSAPELVTSLNAARKGRFGLSAGSLIGSDLFNLLGVLGLASFIRPLPIDPAGLSSVKLLVLMVIVVVIMMRTGWQLSRREGIFLVAVNAVRWWMDMSGGKGP